MNTNSFQLRHIGPNQKEQETMLAAIKADTLEQLISETVPDNIRLKEDLDLAPAMSEYEYLAHINELSEKNKVFKSYIGLGYHEAIVPSVIQRNILENPGWYTAYTPYQAEIAQGRLEALLNYQTMVCDLTGMELANASLLDESTAAAEAMALLFDVRERAKKKAGANKFFVSEEILPQTLSLLQTRSTPIGIELIVGNHENFDFADDFFGAILQYPGKLGQVFDYESFVAKANEKNIKVAVAADILSLIKLKAPGEFGASVVVGTTQRFGIPLGYGGPHAAYFATKEKYKRSIPGRIIGVTKDKNGERALRMALQTREQHIKRERATSNICTAQVLLAVMAGMYAVYHGKNGLQYIADTVHNKTKLVADYLDKAGFKQLNSSYFDTLLIEIDAIRLKPIAESFKVNFNYVSDQLVSISLNEATTQKDLMKLFTIFGQIKKRPNPVKEENYDTFSQILTQEPFHSDFDVINDLVARKTSFLDNPIFNTYQSETDMMRYIKKLENKDLSLVHSMIALGSCTMKLNAAAELIPLSWPEFNNIHPFAPQGQTEGYLEMIDGLSKDLCEITGFAGMSLQPKSGATGEYAGLMVIKAYHIDNGDTQRNICLIPSSAHGT
ncbi:MAG: glycine dehydrogenase (aminomethyl-transferring), partial [Polaribacter sp.]|nr:glycine dehydrogenase (aminomethyl-transferring) [Polaribacter sp.]